jgi:diguanylate cyclase (GGDEF)-like protein
MEDLKMSKPGILIIDDDINLKKTLSDILKLNGYEIVTAKDGREGLALFAENPVNLVLIDLGLPDIPGIKVLKKIKSEHPSTEAIILTGNATLDSAIEATNSGAFSYLLKPYDIDQLILNVRRAIEKQQAEEKIIKHSLELETINAELKILYEVSSAISRTPDLDGLLSQALLTLLELDIFRFEHKGAAFLIEQGRLLLHSRVGFSEEELDSCKNLRIGECLCGLAAATGEIIVSQNSWEDKRHVIKNPDIPPHGHIALPLKFYNDVTGLIVLHIKSGTLLSEQARRLLTTLGNQLGMAINNAKLYEEAKFFSFMDPLTGLPNRRALQIQLEKCVEAAKRYGEIFSVIMLDIDHFKEYNDQHGHVEGDRLLVKLANILSHEMRNSDYIYRYGGDEFLIILTRTDMELARDVADRFRIYVGDNAGVTISLGISTYREIMWNSEALISSVDSALYQAKQEGRNRIVANQL